MTKRLCGLCGKTRWAKGKGEGWVCLRCRLRHGGSDPARLKGKPHPKRIKSKRAKPKSEGKKMVEEGDAA